MVVKRLGALYRKFRDVFDGARNRNTWCREEGSMRYLSRVHHLSDLDSFRPMAMLIVVLKGPCNGV
jgi:hypothetical protein